MPVDFQQKPQYDFDDLIEIVRILRSREGCPWDMVQTHQSIRKDLLEESYELAEAIDRDDPAMLLEELGDVLLQVVFHTGIEQDAGHFDMAAVITEECNKMIIRHPHVFGDHKVTGTDEVLRNWEDIKNQVKGIQKAADTLKNVPAVFPSLMRAEKLVKRARQAGMEFGSLDILYDEVAAKAEKLKNSKDKKGLGELLFSCAALAFLTGEDAEELLSFENEKFVSAFEKTEEEILSSNRKIEEVAPEEFRRIFDSKGMF